VENLRKSSYKTHLIVVKICPYLLGLIYALNSILAYFYIETTWAGYVGHLALIPALSFISQSFVLKFCVYHRLPIYYILVNDGINTYDYFYGIEVSDKGFLLLHIFLVWVTILSIIYFYVKHHKKAASQVT
jgi:hypothetical protein